MLFLLRKFEVFSLVSAEREYCDLSLLRFAILLIFYYLAELYSILFHNINIIIIQVCPNNTVIQL
jgi:hypothetical protein